MMAVDVGQWPMTKTNGLLSLSPSSTTTNIYRQPMMAVEGGASGLESKIVPFVVVSGGGGIVCGITPMSPICSTQVLPR